MFDLSFYHKKEGRPSCMYHHTRAIVMYGQHPASGKSLTGPHESIHKPPVIAFPPAATLLKQRPIYYSSQSSVSQWKNHSTFYFSCQSFFWLPCKNIPSAEKGSAAQNPRACAAACSRKSPSKRFLWLVPRWMRAKPRPSGPYFYPMSTQNTASSNRKHSNSASERPSPRQSVQTR